jgi:hypothetical protein
MTHPQDARNGVLLDSLALWLSQSDPNGDWEELSLEEALSSALALLQENS